jgi:hypothetical protein
MAVRFTAALAVAGAVAVAIGAGLIYLPAGLIVSGIELLTGAYVLAYLEARREAA